MANDADLPLVCLSNIQLNQYFMTYAIFAEADIKAYATDESGNTTLNRANCWVALE